MNPDSCSLQDRLMGLLASGLLSGATTAWALKVGPCTHAVRPHTSLAGRATRWEGHTEGCARTSAERAAAGHSFPGQHASSQHASLWAWALQRRRWPRPLGSPPCFREAAHQPPPHAPSSPQQSADDHTLESDTSERLQLGLMGLAGAALGVHMLHGGCPPASRPASWGAPLGMCVGRLHSLRGRLRGPLLAGAAQSTCSGSLRQQLRQAPPGSTLAPAGSDLTNNGRGLGAATAALTFAVPAARMLGSDRGRRRLGSRIKVCVCVWVGESLQVEVE